MLPPLFAPLLALLSLLAASAAGAGTFFTVRIVGPGVLDRPTFVASPPGDRDRLFIAEQHTGQIRILNLADDSINATPFLTVTDLSTGLEQGLLGFAFHPDYATNGEIYVNFTNSNGSTKVVRYVVSANPDVAEPNGAPIYGTFQPQANHNGGWIGFGPDDGLLYIAVGDGGGGNDDDTGHTAFTGNAQDITNNPLGKIHRIDVDRDDFPMDPFLNYGIPPSNPFVGVTGDDTIWSYGLRHPFRASFDRETGDLYIGDVGQNNREEVNVQAALSGGHNHGWRLREGMIATPTPPGQPVGGVRPVDNVDPIYDYEHGPGNFQGCAVIGGYVYRGPLAALRGRYFFSDTCKARLWSLVFDGSPPANHDGTNFSDLTDHTGDPRFTPDQGSFASPSSFGEDDAGALYYVRIGVFVNGVVQPNTGEIFRVPEPPRIGLQLAVLASIGLLWGARRPLVSRSAAR